MKSSVPGSAVGLASHDESALLNLLENLQQKHGFVPREISDEGQTTPDRQVQFDTVRCIGCCGMAPALVIDGQTCGHVKPADIGGLLARLRGCEGAAA
jgi:NADH:ubiquinone oxidoreductase subunit E